jgi:uncharacterized caspase-like protein
MHSWLGEQRGRASSCNAVAFATHAAEGGGGVYDTTRVRSNPQQHAPESRYKRQSVLSARATEVARAPTPAAENQASIKEAKIDMTMHHLRQQVSDS